MEGYTDSTGSKAYNEALSRRRADSVVEYLVAKHDIPIYRIHMIGLGQEKPVDDARTREARAKNRRVEVKVFNADQVSDARSSGATAATVTAQPGSQVAATASITNPPEPRKQPCGRRMAAFSFW